LEVIKQEINVQKPRPSSGVLFIDI